MSEARPFDNNGWLYALDQVNSDQRGYRSIVSRPSQVKLSGIDGSLIGGLRPYYGFYTVSDIIDASWSPSSVLTDYDMEHFVPFFCSTDDGTKAVWGYVYTIDILGGNNLTAFINYRVDGDATWYGESIPADAGSDQNSILALASGHLAPIGVESVGRYLYITSKGGVAWRLSFSSTISAGSYLTVTVDAGPGKAPKLTLNDTNTYPTSVFTQVVAAALLDPTITTLSADTLTVDRNILDIQSASERPDFVGEVPIPPETNQYANAQIHLSGYPPVDYSAATFTGDPGEPDTPVPTNILLYEGGTSTDYSTSLSIDDQGIWLTSEGVPDLGENLTRKAAQLEAGDYSFAYQLSDSENGLKSVISDIVDITRQKHFHIRRIAQYTTVSFADKNPDQEYPLYAYLEVVYDADRFDTITLYRSAKTQKGGGTATARVLNVDQTVELADYETVASIDPTSTAAGNWKRALIPYILDDPTLVTQRKFTGQDVVFDEIIPKAGELFFDEGIMFYGDLVTDDGNRLSRLKHSDPTDVAAEIVNPQDEYTLKGPDEDIIVMKSLGNSILACSRSRQYLMRREGESVRIDSGNSGFGVPNKYCATSVGSDVYLLTRRGIKQVRPDGLINDITVADRIIRRDWSNQSTDYFMKASIAFDETAGVIYAYSPDAGTAICIWLDTQRMTILENLPFKFMRQAHLPSNPTAATAARFDTRVVWVDTSNTVWLPDYLRENNPNKTLLALGGSTTMRYTITGINTIGSNTSLTVSASISANVDIQHRLVNISSNTYYGEYIPQKANPVSNVFTVDSSHAAKFEIGDTIGVEPVYVEVIGHSLPHSTGDGFETINRFVVRQVTGIGAAFSTVSGNAAGTTDARLNAAIYVGEDETPIKTNFVLDRTGSSEVASISQGTYNKRAPMIDTRGNGILGTELYPAVRIVCPDLDFIMTDMRVNGSLVGREMNKVFQD